MTLLVTLLTLFLAWAPTADATIITWNFNRTGNLGNTTTELGSDGLTVLALEGYTAGLPSPIVGKQDAPKDHGYGINTTNAGEIDYGEALRLLFPVNVVGPVSVRLESLDGLNNSEAWAITTDGGVLLGTGIGGGAITTSVLLPDDHRLRFIVPAGSEPHNDYLVKTVSANVADRQVPEPATLLLLGTGLVGLAWWRRGSK